jgi:DNA repair protein RadC
MSHADVNQKSLNFLQVSEVKIVYFTKVKPSERPTVKCSKDAQEILYNSWDLNTIEHVEAGKIMLLNQANKVLGLATLSNGGVAGSIMDPIVIFQYAINSNASGIILAHNHPSGNLTPSESDIKITKKIKDGADLFNIQILDHIIITPEKDVFTSFADSGYI